MKKILVVLSLVAFVATACNMKSGSQTEETQETTAVEVKAEVEKKACCEKDSTKACCEKDSTKACCDKEGEKVANAAPAQEGETAKADCQKECSDKKECCDKKEEKKA